MFATINITWTMQWFILKKTAFLWSSTNLNDRARITLVLFFIEVDSAWASSAGGYSEFINRTQSRTLNVNTNILPEPQGQLGMQRRNRFPDYRCKILGGRTSWNDRRCSSLQVSNQPSTKHNLFTLTHLVSIYKYHRCIKLFFTHIMYL